MSENKNVIAVSAAITRLTENAAQIKSNARQATSLNDALEVRALEEAIEQVNDRNAGGDRKKQPVFGYNVPSAATEHLDAEIDRLGMLDNDTIREGDVHPVYLAPVKPFDAETASKSEYAVSVKTQQVFG